jgi:uncharacterized membrane protein (UPF0127 family)
MFSCPDFIRFPALAALAVLSACGGSETGGNAAPKSVDDRFPIRVGERTVRMQIAAQPAEMQKGLMFRKSMGVDEGMLFIFTSPQPLSFWMRNTTLPLDIGFFDSGGELKEIYPMYPLDERSVTSRGRSLQFALEMNQGWYGRTGVRPGAKIDLKAVAGALRARGLEPQAVGLR